LSLKTAGEETRLPGFLVGVDIGGTFTDCVVLGRGGHITTAKAPSTPGNFAEGMIEAMRVAAGELRLSFEDFCAQIQVLTHGTTVGTNALIQRKGARVGLITTQGHEDAIHIMRGSRGVTSRDLRKVVHFPENRIRSSPSASSRASRSASIASARRSLRSTKPRPRRQSGAWSRRA
jgi:N-methylhydantoinase A/oxoprolinase/acetone carboxylase beta subunit